MAKPSAEPINKPITRSGMWPTPPSQREE
jgi:hypothetical protein